MKVLYFDCAMGAAGDMITAALLELMPDREEALAELNALGLPGVTWTSERVTRCGIGGTLVHVEIDGREEGQDHPDRVSTAHGDGKDHDRNDGEECHSGHQAHHHGHHHGHSLKDILTIVEGLSLSETAKAHIRAVYEAIAGAESQVHDQPVDQIHFHEVGTMDALADVTAVAYLMEKLSPDRVIVSPIHVGAGTVKCAHGILPVPAPATALLLKNVPIYGGSIRTELCTPTGAALLTHFADDFGNMLAIRTEAIGYGMGKKEFEAANALRVFLGETQEEKRDRIISLECNLDDMTGEEIGFALERLMAEGARDVFTVPIGMKKGRPGILLTVLTDEEREEEMVRQIFRHTTTLGIRRKAEERYVLDRRIEEVQTPKGRIRKKIAEGYGVRREKPEYEDRKKAALESGGSLLDKE